MMCHTIFPVGLKRVCVTGLLLCVAVFSAKPQQFSPVTGINSQYDEQHPVISPQGNIYFTRAFDPENENGQSDPGDVWMGSSTGAGMFDNPARLVELSTRGFDLVLGFLDADRVLVYHDGREKKQGVHQYSRANGSWNYDHPLDLGNNFRNQSPHFSGRLSASGDILILSYSTFGSYGNEDIYVSFLKNGEWTVPKNLGPQINTFQQEMTPSLSADGRILFFSTNAHGSTGGMDVFYAERLDESWENWSSPKPLTERNTPGAELAYFQAAHEQDLAFLTSTQNSEGYGDILMGRQALVLQSEEVETVASPPLAESKREDSKPPVQTSTRTVPPVRKKEAASVSPPAELRQPETEDALFLNAASSGERVILEQVLFQRGTAEYLDGTHKATISSLASFLNRNPELRILLEGHTDNLGNPQLNKELSLNRASAVRKSLMDLGVEFERIRIAGWGGARPIADNSSEEGRSKNRRVELQIIK